MVVRKLFRENPYLTRLSAHVTSLQDNTITLDQTIFFAFSGGQESDTGTIGGYSIQEAQKQGKEIYYTIAGDHNLQVGKQVLIEIDRARRYALMRLHFAAEIILELLYQDYNHPLKIGAHIGPEKSRVDVIRQGNISDIFSNLQRRAQEIIDANHPIISTWSDQNEEKRTREIVGFANVACGGTHIKSTGELGKINLKRIHLGHEKERIEIFLNA